LSGVVEEKANGAGGFFAHLVQDHARIEEELKALFSAADALSRDESDRAAPGVIAAKLDFFARDGARHEELEENVLFPRLRSLPEFAQILAALEFQHRMNRSEGADLRACLERFGPGSGRELRHLAVRFVEMHRGHAVAEERALFPLAASRLSQQVLEELDGESNTRRTSPTPRKKEQR
jgi:hemerythrin-like domain-containing protein